ncbi:phosphopentomutase [Aliiruegeria lutimaris]|uniref:Phosphopentomutase n=1 Tax=Aliiruegeria lutimaris TaxID=571298 RepID=A0A1G9EAX4_9RHOB|nr:phosphopentomutase [Aliiruegeria lutimaris]SDK73211.1 phosphopentomutase [Aliiruegeria lutimaris]
MTRAFLVVMDSVGCGGAPDADRFFNDGVPDTGANTLLHIAQACAEGRAEEGRSGPLKLPNLDALGLGEAVKLGGGEAAPNLGAMPQGRYGAAEETSPGKDTPSGHWELAGVPVPWDWHYFPKQEPTFPEAITRAVCELAETPATLGNCHASGTEIISRLGAEHMKTGWPICYTSADSVFQIAAHEETFGEQRLQDLCKRLAPMLHEMKVGRVISRPFVGSPEAGFTRTSNRHDYAISPPEPTLCDWVQEAGGKVLAVGKIGDIFSMKGIDEVRTGPDAQLMTHLDYYLSEAPEGSLTFANFVEFDSLYGHRRNVSGYARALEWFDAEIGKILVGLQPGDLMVLTADHGNDPTWHGTDHTRERVPVLVHGAGQGSLGNVAFADVAASIAAHLGIAARGPGRNFLPPRSTA